MTALRPPEHDPGDEDHGEWSPAWAGAWLENRVAEVLGPYLGPLTPEARTLRADELTDLVVGPVPPLVQIVDQRLDAEGVLTVRFIDRRPRIEIEGQVDVG